MWPDWAIYWTLGNISLPKSPIFLGNFRKVVKIYHFSNEIIFGNFYFHLVIFFWSHCSHFILLLFAISSNEAESSFAKDRNGRFSVTFIPFLHFNFLLHTSVRTSVTTFDEICTIWAKSLAVLPQDLSIWAQKLNLLWSKICYWAKGQMLSKYSSPLVTLITLYLVRFEQH